MSTVSDKVGALHKAHVESNHESTVKNIYDIALKTKWQYTIVYFINGTPIAFVPCRNPRPLMYVETDYCLGSLYYGSYYLLEDWQVNLENLGVNTFILSEDYTEAWGIPATIPLTLLLCL